jgi:hypothetical protein
LGFWLTGGEDKAVTHGLSRPKAHSINLCSSYSKKRRETKTIPSWRKDQYLNSVTKWFRAEETGRPGFKSYTCLL